MSSVAYLFVYGTLKSGIRRNRYARYLVQNADLLGKGRTPGRLFALKRYPGLRRALGEQEWVQGEVFRLRTPVQTLQYLDGYEGPDYRRMQQWVECEGGHRQRCWVYVWQRALARMRRVESGIWEGQMS